MTDDRQVAAAWMRELGQAQADAQLVTALDGLAGDGRPVAAFGFSLGGRESFAVTFLRPDLAGATLVGYCPMTAEEGRAPPALVDGGSRSRGRSPRVDRFFGCSRRL